MKIGSGSTTCKGCRRSSVERPNTVYTYLFNLLFRRKKFKTIYKTIYYKIIRYNDIQQGCWMKIKRNNECVHGEGESEIVLFFFNFTDVLVYIFGNFHENALFNFAVSVDGI